MKYYYNKLKENIKRNFNHERIKKYGFKLSIYNFLIFLMHRNDSILHHWLMKKRDVIVQKYLYKNYYELIKKFGDY